MFYLFVVDLETEICTTLLVSDSQSKLDEIADSFTNMMQNEKGLIDFENCPETFQIGPLSFKKSNCGSALWKSEDNKLDIYHGDLVGVSEVASV